MRRVGDQRLQWRSPDRQRAWDVFGQNAEQWVEFSPSGVLAVGRLGGAGDAGTAGRVQRWADRALSRRRPAPSVGGDVEQQVVAFVDTSSMRASGRSVLLTTGITGRCAASALHPALNRVCGSGPSEASMRRRTSTIDGHARPRRRVGVPGVDPDHGHPAVDVVPVPPCSWPGS